MIKILQYTYCIPIYFSIVYRVQKRVYIHFTVLRHYTFFDFRIALLLIH